MLDREKVIKGLEDTAEYFRYFKTVGFFGDQPIFREHEAQCNDALALLKEQEAVVHCKDCKHRPKEPNWKTYENGFDIEFPEDSKCPCRCSGDEYYSWYPEDDWFCANGEKRLNNVRR